MNLVVSSGLFIENVVHDEEGLSFTAKIKCMHSESLIKHLLDWRKSVYNKDTGIISNPEDYKHIVRILDTDRYFIGCWPVSMIPGVELTEYPSNPEAGTFIRTLDVLLRYDSEKDKP